MQIQSRSYSCFGRIFYFYLSLCPVWKLSGHGTTYLYHAYHSIRITISTNFSHLINLFIYLTGNARMLRRFYNTGSKNMEVPDVKISLTAKWGDPWMLDINNQLRLEPVLFERLDSIRLWWSSCLVTSFAEFSGYMQPFASLLTCCHLLLQDVQDLMKNIYPKMINLERDRGQLKRYRVLLHETAQDCEVFISH